MRQRARIKRRAGARTFSIVSPRIASGGEFAVFLPGSGARMGRLKRLSGKPPSHERHCQPRSPCSDIKSRPTSILGGSGVRRFPSGRPGLRQLPRWRVIPPLTHEMQQDPQQREVSKFGLINRRPQVIRLQRERSEPVQSRTEAPGLKSPCPESLGLGRNETFRRN